MEVRWQQERRGQSDGTGFATIPKSCSGQEWDFPKGASGGVVKRRARAGWAEAGESTGRLLPTKACCKGEHNVRTLYGEGTARDLLRAV